MSKLTTATNINTNRLPVAYREFIEVIDEALQPQLENDRKTPARIETGYDAHKADAQLRDYDNHLAHLLLPSGFLLSHLKDSNRHTLQLTTKPDHLKSVALLAKGTEQLNQKTWSWAGAFGIILEYHANNKIGFQHIQIEAAVTQGDLHTTAMSASRSIISPDPNQTHNNVEHSKVMQHNIPPQAALDFSAIGWQILKQRKS